MSRKTMTSTQRANAVIKAWLVDANSLPLTLSLAKLGTLLAGAFEEVRLEPRGGEKCFCIHCGAEFSAGPVREEG